MRHGAAASVVAGVAALAALLVASGGALAQSVERRMLVTVLDGHPAALGWLGSAAGRRVYPLGVDRFGQSGDVPDLYRDQQIDTASIIDRAALACREMLAR